MERKNALVNNQIFHRLMKPKDLLVIILGFVVSAYLAFDYFASGWSPISGSFYEFLSRYIFISGITGLVLGMLGRKNIKILIVVVSLPMLGVALLGFLGAVEHMKNAAMKNIVENLLRGFVSPIIIICTLDLLALIGFYISSHKRGGSQ